MFEVGQVVGGYELVRRLAAGGMATVFVAQKDGEPFAIKVIHEHLSEDWEAMRWFIDEALICVRIRHPNVVRVDELGEQSGLYYLAMEYVHGCSLAELMVALHRKGRRLDPWIAAWIAARVAEALHAAHELRGDEGERLGVIHRDISPQNILIAHDGTVKLTDFGIARAEGRAERTRQGEIRGKFRYMAPEQLRSNTSLDHRVDVFALGVVLWELLTQKRLYDQMDQATMMAQLREPKIERPSEHRADIPPQLEGILLNAVAANADERPHDAQVLQEELDLALEAAGGSRQEELSALVLELLGRKLLENAQTLPRDLAVAIGIESFEPTIPRARRDEKTGEVHIETRPAASAPAASAAASASASASEADGDAGFAPPPPEPTKGASMLGWILAVVLVLALTAGGVYWLSLD